jgi:hypothetical protein
VVQRLRAETVPESEAAALRRAAAEHAKVADAKVAEACARADDADRELAAAVALGKKVDAQLAEVMKVLNPYPESLQFRLVCVCVFVRLGVSGSVCLRVCVRLGAQFAIVEGNPDPSDGKCRPCPFLRSWVCDCRLLMKFVGL